MPTQDQISWAWDRFGLTGIAVLFFMYWVLPRAQIIFDKHCLLVDALTLSATAHEKHHEKTHQGIMCLGNAVLESAPDDKRPRAEPHITMLKDQMRKVERPAGA